MPMLPFVFQQTPRFKQPPLKEKKKRIIIRKEPVRGCAKIIFFKGVKKHEKVEHTTEIILRNKRKIQTNMAPGD